MIWGKRTSRWLLVTLFCSIASLAARPAFAAPGSSSASAKSAPGEKQAPFNAEERALLVEGKSVKRGFVLQRDDIQYRAGLSYRLIEAHPMDVMRALRRPRGIEKSIPYGLEAVTFNEKSGVAQVHILQGKRPIVGEYTVRLEWDLGNYSARFWMDPSYDHDLRDIWGVFSAREVSPGWTLVTFGFAFHIGGVGQLLERKAQRWALSTSDRIARLLEEPTTGRARRPRQSVLDGQSVPTAAAAPAAVAAPGSAAPAF